MGKFLLLAHLQSAPCAGTSEDSSPEYLPIKNTFIHFDVPRESNNVREAALPRHRTAPSAQVSKIPRGWSDQCDAKPVDISTVVESLCRWTTMEGDDDSALASRWTTMEGDNDSTLGDDDSTLASDGKPQLCRWTTMEGDDDSALASRWTTMEGNDDSTLASDGKSVSLDNDIYAAPPEDACNETSAQIPDVDVKRVSNPSSDEMPTFTTPSLQVDQDDAGIEGPGSTWLVDGRRLRGRDTRVSSVLRPLVAGGPAFAELVIMICPLPVSSKRGGANFKAANGIGRIQLKCNNPVDMDLFVCIAVGTSPTRCEKHNFADNPLMTFNGDWDFKASIDPNADRPTVAVTLQLLEAKEGADLPMCEGACTAPVKVGPAVMDPAIVAFGCPKSPTKSAFSSEAAQLQAHVWGSEASTTYQGTPEVSPRSHLQQPTTPQFPSPSPSPFFSLGGSFLFMFTIRRADGVELGLDVMVDEINHELTVRNVIPNGAAEAWNRQCFAGPYSSKAIVPTDRIVGINGHCDCQGMLEECRERQLLKIFVVRGDLAHADIPLGWCGVPTPIPTIQFVPVPVFFPVTCVKHDIVDCHGGHAATSPDQLGGGTVLICSEAPTSRMLRASAPEFIPPGTGQEDDTLTEGEISE